MSSREDIDIALGRYYKLVGRNDYFDNTGNGKFILWCTENGFDIESIRDELQQGQDDPLDCLLITFDADDNDIILFPLDPPINDDKKKATKIVKIIRKCYENKNAFKSLNDLIQINDDGPSIPNIDTNFFNIKPIEIKTSLKIMKKQAPVIYNKALATDVSLNTILAIGHKKKFPFIQLLADNYLRDRVTNKTSLDPGPWIKSHPYFKQFKVLKTNKSQPLQLIEGALNSYFFRVCPNLSLPPIYLIDDSLKDCIEYIVAVASHVNTLANAPTPSVVPFQLDACFAFPNVIQAPNVINDNKNNNNNDDDDDYNDVSSSDDDDDDWKFTDEFGNIRNKLKATGLKYKILKLKGTKKEREYSKTFDLLKADINNYPQNGRICSIFDRRNKDLHKLIMWQPPSNCNKIPHNYVHEWFWNSSLTSIIPNIDYNTNKHSSNNISTSNSCKGALIVFSFHVFAQDTIRCYLYMNSKVTRFMPQDIIGLLPKFFVQTPENIQYATSSEAKKLSTTMKLPDIVFKKFIASIQT